MSQTRYLTKSRFKLGMECPTKLYYTGKPEYANRSFEDPFLLQLANGGFQVDALAREYYPEGQSVLTQNYDSAVEVTNAMLSAENVTIFQAAFRYGTFFVRADIVIKTG